MREPIRIVPGSDAEAQSTSICCWDSAEPLKLSGNVMSAIAASAKIRARIGSSSFDRRLLTAKDPEPEPSGEPEYTEECHQVEDRANNRWINRHQPASPRGCWVWPGELPASVQVVRRR